MSMIFRIDGLWGFTGWLSILLFRPSSWVADNVVVAPLQRSITKRIHYKKRRGSKIKKFRPNYHSAICTECVYVHLTWNTTTTPCSFRLHIRRKVPSRWLAPRYGMASLWHSTHSLELFLRHSSLNLRWSYLVVLGLGALLSSSRWRGAIQILTMNEWMNEWQRKLSSRILQDLRWCGERRFLSGKWTFIRGWELALQRSPLTRWSGTLCRGHILRIGPHNTPTVRSLHQRTASWKDVHRYFCFKVLGSQSHWSDREINQTADRFGIHSYFVIDRKLT